MEYCKFCGEPLNEEGKCPNVHEFKKMCINCEFCVNNGAMNDDGEAILVCDNAENKAAAIQKMMDLLNKEKNGYSVTKLEVEPVPLKKVTLKCPKWALTNSIKHELPELFK